MTLFVPFLGPACIQTATWPPHLLCCLCQINSPLFLHEIDMVVPTLCGCEVTWDQILDVVSDMGQALPVFSLNRTWASREENLGNCMGNKARAEGLVLPLLSLLVKQA